MTKRLESIDPGTPVFCDDRRVGEVRGVFGIGDSRLAEYVCVYCQSRTEEVLVPTGEVLEINDRGVDLAGPLETLMELSVYNPASAPSLNRLH